MFKFLHCVNTTGMSLYPIFIFAILYISNFVFCCDSLSIQIVFPLVIYICLTFVLSEYLNAKWKSSSNSHISQKCKLIFIYLQIKGPADFSNFDNYPKNSEVPPDETSGWDINFWDQPNM